MPSPTQQIPVSPPSPKKMNGKINLFSHIKYEHMLAGVSGKIGNKTDPRHDNKKYLSRRSDFNANPASA